MTDLGITDFRLEIEQRGERFIYRVYFTLTATGGSYSSSGGAESPMQCFDFVMSYLAEIVREAVQ